MSYYAEPVASTPVAKTVEYTQLRRFALLFVFFYLFLYNFPFPLGTIPGTDFLNTLYDELFSRFVRWVARHALRIKIDSPMGMTGSGDRLQDYVTLAVMAAMAASAALVSLLAGVRAPQYEKWHARLRVYVRYVLAVTMMSYGWSKLFKTQFPFPNAARLVEPYGESSPMGLLWTFMGYSTGYNIFTGAAEALGGMLLLFRRTTTLGALVVCAVMSNVVMLNFCYDVPVKLYSSHLLFMAMFLLLPDLRRLADALILGRATAVAPITPAFSSRRTHLASRAAKAIFIVYLLIHFTQDRIERQKKYGADASRQPLSGAYLVEEWQPRREPAGSELQPAMEWRKVVINSYGGISLLLADDSRQRFRMEHNPGAQTITLDEGGAAHTKYVLACTQPDPQHLVLQGVFMNTLVKVRLRRIDESAFLLVARGFHWVNEVPFNR